MTKKFGIRTYMFLLGVVFIILLASPSWGGDKIIQSNDNNTQTSGDIKGDSSRAFGIGIPGLGDVDIAGCLGSEQWTLLIGGKQKLVINWPCMAEFYLRNGAPELAAMALCNTEILDEFKSEQECETAHKFLEYLEAPEPVAVIEDNDEEIHAQLVQEQQTYLAQLESRVARVEAKKTVKPQIIKETVIEQKPLLTKEQAAELRYIK